MGTVRFFLLIMVLASIALPCAALSGEIDWSKAESSSVVLFYPGVTSWDFLIGDDHRLGGREIKKGKKDCRHCHLSKGGELDMKVDEIAAGTVKMKRSHRPFEPEPQAGKKGSVLADVQAAYDKEHLYLRFRWASTGAGWSGKGKGPDRISVQMNKAEQSFAKYGCFVTCHNDNTSMPMAPSKAEIEARPAFKGRDDVRLYAYYARSSWAEKRPGSEARSRDGLIDLKSVELEAGRAKVLDGWIFDDRDWQDKHGSEAAGSWAGGRYTVIIKTRLNSASRQDVAISEGDLVTIGVAIHDEGAARRKHYVSFPFSIGIGTGKGDVQAVRAAH